MTSKPNKEEQLHYTCLNQLATFDLSGLFGDCLACDIGGAIPGDDGGDELGVEKTLEQGEATSTSIIVASSSSS